jgi:3-hydroxyacyl-[acyl-carrier-protein] dehydratase
MPANPPSDIQRVFRHVPHRYPFVLVDHVEACEAGAWVRARKHVSFDEPFFETVRDERPAMPPTLIVEALAQAGGVLCLYSGLTKPDGASIAYLAGIDHTRFERPAYAGETLILDCRIARALRGVVRLECRATVDGELAVETRLTVVIRDAEPAPVAS